MWKTGFKLETLESDTMLLYTSQHKQKYELMEKASTIHLYNLTNYLVQQKKTKTYNWYNQWLVIVSLI
jgi:hypothetical protein